MLAAMTLVASGYTLSMHTAAPVIVQRRSACAVMQEDVLDTDLPWNDPREGKPFGEADGDNRPVGKVRNAVEAYQPRGITDATVIKPQYIETDDEPWHSTSRATVMVTKTDFAAADLPFIGAEEALEVALSKVEDAKAAQSAMDTALKAGARPGCPAIVAGEKVIKAFNKDAEAGMKARPKAPKNAAQGKGWDGYAPGLAKTHDNSV
mmetsp:Transcript_46974/g.123252  ORF Transcript_46974/g.123252 Transcript_46974/m.123252 type:complete len:207 (-) Transcript_46974:366-986(-)|eukprot:CAMPEP_0115839802 /NCGR_PEP_ID=MMETSP0287-20121206/6443_1 /TAXON_ID=412157 /ORGANISM="Chrysochromulina rotalis, Strain UIO044" /LENGTH=206 /DNA_ID=CAMNT_0003293393 /DNA_START=57 /DNA_END=677 /DNA_ORIENTATION=-